jgi:hypothetical protein
VLFGCRIWCWLAMALGYKGRVLRVLFNQNLNRKVSGAINDSLREPPLKSRGGSRVAYKARNRPDCKIHPMFESRTASIGPLVNCQEKRRERRISTIIHTISSHPEDCHKPWFHFLFVAPPVSLSYRELQSVREEQMHTVKQGGLS